VTPIVFRTHGGCAVITIDRAAARNAINPEVARGIEAAVDRLEEDESLRAGVLTGAPPVFCAGADLKALAAGQAAELSTDRGGFAGLVRRRRTKPLVAAVDGPALAGGLELVLACDLVVASREAVFGAPEVHRGLIAAAGALFRLPHVLAPNLALEYLLTGDPFDAELAHRHGLVNRLCEPGEALDVALALAQRIARNAPLAVRLSREVVGATRAAAEDGAWISSDAANEAVMRSADSREGVRAFVEKRPPVWEGR
jgi:enoyl-CoA hydratase